jgi:hypothetical protein
MDAISNNNISDEVKRYDCRMAVSAVLSSMTVADLILCMRTPSTKRGAWIRIREMLEMDMKELEALYEMTEEDAG